MLLIEICWLSDRVVESGKMGFCQSREYSEIVKAQVRDLRYNSGNLYSNCIIRHMLTKWTDNPVGICEWSIRMACKGLGTSKYVSLGLVTCMFTVYCISIIFYCLLFVSYYWIALESAPVSQPKYALLHFS